MAKKDNTVLYIGAAVAIYFLFFKKSAATPTATAPTLTMPTSAAPTTSSLLPFSVSSNETVSAPQVSPTPASVLDPQQLKNYNLGLPLSTPASGSGGGCCGCVKLNGINKNIYVC
jgi:hypothetical protein